MNENLIHIDNLQLMQQIEEKSIDLIYADVLFGTGKNFTHYKDLPKNFTKIKEFYWHRFELMHKILKDTGILYVHCGININHWLRIFLDEIFGIENFRNEIIWYYNSGHRKLKDFGQRHDYILRYSKSSNYYFNANSPLIREPYSLTAPRGYAKEKYYNPLGKVFDDVWELGIIGQNDKTERTGYPTQKPEELLYPIIASSTPPNGIVFDPFCGSGTTLVVAKKLGFNYLGCDTSKKAIEIAKLRINYE